MVSVVGGFGEVVRHVVQDMDVVFREFTASIRVLEYLDSLHFLIISNCDSNLDLCT